MKPIQIILILIYFILLLTNLNAEKGTYSAPKVGTIINGGIFLHREPVEMYWDDWISYPLMDRQRLPSSDQVELLIKGEGKTVVFYGVLSINCNNSKYFWEGIPSNAGDVLDDSNINSIVPHQVINSAITLFCKK